jgi:cold shock CspA family protein
MVGTITHWNDRKGFGFLTVSSGEQFFFHITQFKEKDHHKPVKGAICSFALGKPIADVKKVQAIDVRFAKPEEIGLRTITNNAGVVALIAGGRQ